MKKLKSLTIFFPFLNDAGTVEKSISDAYYLGKKVTKDLEVIAIHGGDSKDETFQKILKEKEKHPDLTVIDKTNNWEGYAVIKYGFMTAKKEWIFYTDGDMQYHLSQLNKLVQEQQKTDADVVNGYKRNRADNVIRIFFGNAYRRVSQILFQLPIRDLDCDFRLVRKTYIKKIYLVSHDASILPELIKKLQFAKAKFAEVPVTHYKRKYGKSNYSPWQLLKQKIVGDIKLWFRLRSLYNVSNENP